MACKPSRRPSVTPEEAELRAVRARRRFKALVRCVIHNRNWLDDDDDEKLGENVAKNIHLLTRKKKGKKSTITLHDKAVLNMPGVYRTEQEKLALADVFGKIKCFEKFSEPVLHRLATVTYYSYYEAGRTIIRQGHDPHNIYFILSGNVTISLTRMDMVFNETVTVSAGTLGAGAMFGEVSLLLNIARTATVTTLTPCEFLYVHKNDFNTVLRGPVTRLWDKTMNSLRRFSYFKQWDEVSLRECCVMSKLKSFQRDETILGDGQGLKNSVYFILKGKCKVIEHLMLSVTREENGKKQFKLYQGAIKKKQSQPELKREFRGSAELTTAETVRRNTLNIMNKPAKIKLPKPDGKGDTNITFAKTHEQDELDDYNLPPNVETHFMQKNKGNLWTRIQQYLNSHIPNTNKIFSEFLEQRKWRAYKNQLVDSIVRRSAANLINNVPYSIRIHEDYDFVE